MIRPPLITSDVVFSSVNVNKQKTNSNIIKSFSPWKDPVKVTSKTNIAISGLTTIDSVILEEYDRVLLQGQTTESENGIYLVRTNNWVRSPDMPNGSIIDGCVVYVKEGTLYNGLFFYTDSLGIVGSDSIQFNTLNDNIVSDIPAYYVVVKDANGFTGYESFKYSEDKVFGINTSLGQGDPNTDFTITTPETLSEGINLDIIASQRDLTFGSDTNLVVQTGNLATEKGTGGDITISTGENTSLAPLVFFTPNRRGYLKTQSSGTTTFQSNGSALSNNNIYLVNSVDTTNSLEKQLCYTSFGTSTNIVLFKLNRMELVITSVTVANLAASPVTNSPQGTIVITNPSTLLANTFIDVVVQNNLIQSTTLIKMCVATYAGTGQVAVNCVSKTASTGFVMRVTNCSGTNLSASPLSIRFWTF